jgi:predicted RNase H-like HicB family nuclease
MTDAISFHLEGLQAEGLQIPQPHSFSTYVDVPA